MFKYKEEEQYKNYSEKNNSHQKLLLNNMILRKRIQYLSQGNLIKLNNIKHINSTNFIPLDNQYNSNNILIIDYLKKYSKELIGLCGISIGALGLYLL